MAKSSYSFERLQREKEKAAKADAKKQKRQEKKSSPPMPDHGGCTGEGEAPEEAKAGKQP